MGINNNQIKVHQDKHAAKVRNYYILRSCNNNCLMCVYANKSNEMMHLEDIASDLKSLDKNTKTIYVSGGEPTLHPDFFEILKKARANFNGNIHILTNGRTFSINTFIKKLDLDIGNAVFGVPFHSSYPKVFDEITQVPGSFMQTVKGINNLTSAGQSVELRIIINMLNYSMLPEIAWFIRKNFPAVDKVLFISMDLIGNAAINKDILAVRISKTTPYLHKAIDILEGHFQILLNQIPLCLLDPDYHKFAHRGTFVEREHSFSKWCKNCIRKKDCGGTWKSYISFFGSEEFKPIK